jgi:hypothetical protein
MVRLFDLRDGSQAAQFAAADDTGGWRGGIAQQHRWQLLQPLPVRISLQATQLKTAIIAAASGAATCS